MITASIRLVLCATLTLCALQECDATVIVQFEQDEYTVSGADEQLRVGILLDADLDTPDTQQLTKGLFSFGVRMNFDGAKARVDGPADVNAVPELDYFGLSSGAFKTVKDGSAAVKGNIDQLNGPNAPYQAALLAEFNLTNLATAPDTYTLTLDLFNTLGNAEQLFIDGESVSLDDQIVFGTAIVNVVPEPSNSLLLLSIVFIGYYRSRRETNRNLTRRHGPAVA